MTLHVRGLCVAYDGTPAVKDLSLSLEPGEIVALLGPNGAGKTTTLLAITGFVNTTSGEVSIGDTSLVRCKPHQVARQGVALVADDRWLFPTLTVRQNLELGVRRRRRSRLQPAITEIESMFPTLERLSSRHAGLLSGGEQQMLAVARALMARPKVLLLDEMSHGLAPLIVRDLLDRLRRIADDGTAILLVEQHVDMALDIADRAIVIDRGVQRLAGPAAELRQRQHEFNELYVGTQ